MTSLPTTASYSILRRILFALGVESTARTLYHRYRYWRAMRAARVSETSKCRARLAPFCTGYGVDLGFGGDPITPHAVRVDFPRPYTEVGAFPVQLGGDAARLEWFRDGALDFVFSSHLLEDFEDTGAVLREWLRVLKPGGRLIIFCPDEVRYRVHCKRTGQFHNPNHKHAFFSLEYVKTLLAGIGQLRVVHENAEVNVYSWELVVEKTR
jgi:predicted SAM-dependent methyltransferase